MKSPVKYIIVLVALSISSCTWNQSEIPADFAIKIEGMFHDKVDTFNGTYVRSGVKKPKKKEIINGRETGRNIIEYSDSVVYTTFTIQEKQELYSLLRKINYTTYPDTSKIECESDIVPSHKIHIKVRANNRIKYISYNDGCQDNNNEIKAARSIVNLTMEILERHKEVKQLPETVLLDL
ncbi:hypothetical protein J0X19_06695 [Hymenobacter sp. BT186]|uniref:DUF4136 domain-containing protein n=1 Tax=Hymenobacter telluris TaxID=2816474 RepID=A0A939JCT4_9BACT|nr:hypothetical protein [Hymenobacter telluris]MBO0357627.1 hypothetical protein [Hymenobacter telluris]MBW3373653.1 hypothetical protein [Hymenobacter norwichensis]